MNRGERVASSGKGSKHQLQVSQTTSDPLRPARLRTEIPEPPSSLFHTLGVADSIMYPVLYNAFLPATSDLHYLLGEYTAPTHH